MIDSNLQVSIRSGPARAGSGNRVAETPRCLSEYRSMCGTYFSEANLRQECPLDAGRFLIFDLLMHANFKEHAS